jgi:hypothetical protein
MRWWKWPQPDTGHIIDVGPELSSRYGGLLEGASFWRAANVDQGPALVVTAHAGAALKERVWDLHERAAPGLPVMAPYFDMAFGWGVGLMLWLLPPLHLVGGAVMAPVLLGAGAALLWDLPVRALEEFGGVDKISSVPVIMGAAVLLPLLLLLRPGASFPSSSSSRAAAAAVTAEQVEADWLLFSIQLAVRVVVASLSSELINRAVAVATGPSAD